MSGPTVRRDAHPLLPPDRGPVFDKGITLVHLRCTLDHFARRCSRTGPGCAASSLHRAVGRGRPAVLRLPRPLGGRPGAPVPDLPERGLDRVGRLRRGQPAGAAGLRHRLRGLHRLRVRHGRGPHADVPQQRRGHARHDRGRRPLQPLLASGRGGLPSAVCRARALPEGLRVASWPRPRPSGWRCMRSSIPVDFTGRGRGRVFRAPEQPQRPDIKLVPGRRGRTTNAPC